jgi:hypothetical protein
MFWQYWGGGDFACSNDFYLYSRRLEWGGQCTPQSSARIFLQSSELGLLHPLTRRRVFPHRLVPGEVHTCMKERGWGSPNSDERTDAVVLRYIYLFFVVHPVIITTCLCSWRNIGLEPKKTTPKKQGPLEIFLLNEQRWLKAFYCKRNSKCCWSFIVVLSLSVEDLHSHQLL